MIIPRDHFEKQCDIDFFGHTAQHDRHTAKAPARHQNYLQTTSRLQTVPEKKYLLRHFRIPKIPGGFGLC